MLIEASQENPFLLEPVLKRAVVTDMGYKTPCWVSDRSPLAGSYTKVNIRALGGITPTHRYSLYLLFGELPAGLETHVDHLCRVGKCCRPSHLEIVPRRENILRGMSPSADNARKTHCIRGHAFTPENIRRAPSRPNGRYCRACDRLRSAS